MKSSPKFNDFFFYIYRVVLTHRLFWKVFLSIQNKLVSVRYKYYKVFKKSILRLLVLRLIYEYCCNNISNRIFHWNFYKEIVHYFTTMSLPWSFNVAIKFKVILIYFFYVYTYIVFKHIIVKKNKNILSVTILRKFSV